MKNLVFLILIISVALISCGEEEPTNAISAEEAAELVGSVFASENGGVAQIASLTVAINESENPNNGRVLANCDELVNVEFSVSSPEKAIRQVNFSYFFDVRFTCNPSLDPLSFTADMSASGTYDGPNFGSSLTVSLDWLVDQILNNEQPLLAQGDLNVEATSENKVNGNEYVFSVSLTVDNAAIDKMTGFIESGSASLSIRGTANGGSFNFANASVTFVSGNQATLVIGGQRFTMNLRTGVVTS